MLYSTFADAAVVFVAAACKLPFDVDERRIAELHLMASLWQIERHDTVMIMMIMTVLLPLPLLVWLLICGEKKKRVPVFGREKGHEK